jgi:Domain of unknown function (DUF4412)
MRALVAIVVAALAVPCVAQADFEGVLVSKMTGDMNGTTRTWLSGAGIRAETEMTVPEAKQATLGKSLRSVAIVKTSDPNTTYFLDENTKSYRVFVHKPDEHADDDQYIARRLGKDKVAGFSCERVALTSPSGNASEVCVASDFIGSDTWLRAFQVREQRSGGLHKALLDAGVKGLPIRWSSKGKDGHGAFQVELVSAKKQSVPASTFAIPADYTKSEMAMPFSSPETAKKMDEAMKKMTPEQRKQMEEMMKKFGGDKN